MRDVELEPLPDDPGDPGGTPPVPATAGDDAFKELPAAGVNAGAGLTDASFGDHAFVMPSTGGEFGPGRVALVDGPADGGLADMEAGATVAAPAAPVAKPAYSMAGRSINPATKKRLFPWLNTPPTGLNTSYASNIANPGMLEAPAVAMGAVTMETPRDDDEGDEDEEEATEKPEEDIPESPTRKRLFTRKSKGK